MVNTWPISSGARSAGERRRWRSRAGPSARPARPPREHRQERGLQRPRQHQRAERGEGADDDPPRVATALQAHEQSARRASSPSRRPPTGSRRAALRAQVLHGEDRESHRQQTQARQAQHPGDGDPAQLGHGSPATRPERATVQTGAPLRPRQPGAPSRPGNREDQAQRRQRQRDLDRDQRRLRPEGGGQRPRQRGPDDQRQVEARCLERVGRREQPVRHDHRDQAAEAAERERVGQTRPGALSAARTDRARCPPAAGSRARWPRSPAGPTP